MPLFWEYIFVMAMEDNMPHLISLSEEKVRKQMELYKSKTRKLDGRCTYFSLVRGRISNHDVHKKCSS